MSQISNLFQKYKPYYRDNLLLAIPVVILTTGACTGANMRYRYYRSFRRDYFISRRITCGQCFYYPDDDRHWDLLRPYPFNCPT